MLEANMVAVSGVFSWSRSVHHRKHTLLTSVLRQCVRTYGTVDEGPHGHRMAVVYKLKGSYEAEQIYLIRLSFHISMQLFCSRVKVKWVITVLHVTCYMLRLPSFTLIAEYFCVSTWSWALSFLNLTLVDFPSCSTLLVSFGLSLSSQTSSTS